jgi:hypothetical protein
MTKQDGACYINCLSATGRQKSHRTRLWHGEQEEAQLLLLLLLVQLQLTVLLGADRGCDQRRCYDEKGKKPQRGTIELCKPVMTRSQQGGEWRRRGIGVASRYADFPNSWVPKAQKTGKKEHDAGRTATPAMDARSRGLSRASGNDEAGDNGIRRSSAHSLNPGDDLRELANRNNWTHELD